MRRSPRGLGIKLSPHQIDLQEVLALAELRGTLPREAVAIGLEPERVELGVGVSPAVERGLDALLERVAARLLAWGHTLAMPHADLGAASTPAESSVGTETQREALRPGRRIELRGVTQGVGLRPFIHRVARECGVTGRASNSGCGLTIEAFGSDAALDRLLARIARPGDAPGEIERLEWEPLRGRAPDDFAIEPGTRDGERQIALAPDLATCAECQREASDPADRRFGYVFTSCSSCGPRFTIARELPYERARTSMDAFALCGACRREYASPGERRHHAETNACPECGPRLRLATPQGRTLARDADALEAAARLLQSGGVLGVRGIGGYHLAVAATDPAAVGALARAQASAPQALRRDGARSRRGARPRARLAGRGGAARLSRGAHRAAAAPSRRGRGRRRGPGPALDRSAASLHAVAPAAARGDPAAARDDLRQPLGRADRLRRRRGGRAPRGPGGRLPAPRSGDRRALRRFGGARRRRPRVPAAPLARLRAPPAAAAAPVAAHAARVRRAAREHLLSGARRARLALPAPWRPRLAGGGAGLRAGGGAHGALARHAGRGGGPRPPPALRVHALCARARGRAPRRRAAPSRARGVRDRRARARGTGARRGLRRHRPRQ